MISLYSSASVGTRDSLCFFPPPSAPACVPSSSQLFRFLFLLFQIFRPTAPLFLFFTDSSTHVFIPTILNKEAPPPINTIKSNYYSITPPPITYNLEKGSKTKNPTPNTTASNRLNKQNKNQIKGQTQNICTLFFSRLKKNKKI